MELAIDEALHSNEPLKCGVVITRDDIVIAKQHNSQRLSNDATSHAEIRAVRKAGQKLQNKNLNGCTAFCTCEPCIMCLSALCFAKIDKLFYGLSLKDVSPKEKSISIDIYTFLKEAPYKFEVVKNFMKDECKKTLL
ncbi:MAG: nucleoside deaminase [Candidatus Magasanikbacteria bacterium]|nr:nucleoside deaminase [Candidatus Magasanikbacteria bacterium]